MIRALLLALALALPVARTRAGDEPSVLASWREALELDVGRFVRGGASTAAVLYSISLAVRVLSYARFALTESQRGLRGLERLRSPSTRCIGGSLDWLVWISSTLVRRSTIS